MGEGPSCSLESDYLPVSSPLLSLSISFELEYVLDASVRNLLRLAAYQSLHHYAELPSSGTVNCDDDGGFPDFLVLRIKESDIE